MKPLGIYIHIPFCMRRCPYCGFYSNTIGGCSEIADYFDMLEKELEFRYRESGSSFYVDSIYFGGGTPSLADPELIGGMIDKIASLYHVADECEISMEANPGTLSGFSIKTHSPRDAADRLKAYGSEGVNRLKEYRAAGVNRLSLGVQSFDDGVLKTLGRIHSAEDARRGFDDARAAGFDNVSMDLMFGVPGQTEEIWESTVEHLASMRPEHVSFYSLQIEEGTKFYHDYKMGDMVPVTDEEDRRMYHTGLEILREHGYSQYEISNAALPGRECRHDLKYWTFCDYLGVGASASSFMNGVRRTNPGAEYTKYAAAGFPENGLAEDHANSLFDNAADYMITGLRLSCGISLSDFENRFGRSVWEMFPDARRELSDFFASGRIVESGGRLRITESGFDISNQILSAFV